MRKNDFNDNLWNYFTMYCLYILFFKENFVILHQIYKHLSYGLQKRLK